MDLMTDKIEPAHIFALLAMKYAFDFAKGAFTRHKRQDIEGGTSVDLKAMSDNVSKMTGILEVVRLTQAEVNIRLNVLEKEMERARTHAEAGCPKS